MTIQEAAEKFSKYKTDQEMYVTDVSHYESLMRAAGYEWVKVDVQTDADIQKMIPEFGSTRFHLTTADIHKALAIGREQGRKEANADSINNLNKLAGNPHLLREDGEKELRLGQKVYHKDIYYGREEMTVVGIRKDQVELEGDYSGGTHNVCQRNWESIDGIIATNPRPTDMEQEARKMLDGKTFIVNKDKFIPFEAIDLKNAITALTEFGKMWYERGREEMPVQFRNRLNEHKKREAYLTEQLAEKDRDLEAIANLSTDCSLECIKLQDELTAAKKQLAEKDKELSHCYEGLKLCSDEIKKLNDELTATKEQLAEKDNECYTHEMRSLETRREAEGLRIELTAAKAQLAEKDKEIDKYYTQALFREQDILKLQSELTAAKAEIERLKRDNKAHTSTNAQLSEHINYLNEKIQKLESYPCTCSSDIERLGCKEMCDFNKSLKTKT